MYDSIIICFSQCTEEAHRPVNCETVSKWTLKNSAESENMNWFVAGSSLCYTHLMCLFPLRLKFSAFDGRACR
jgi:hypothetical protein